MLKWLHGFRGGVHPPQHKEPSRDRPIAKIPLPSTLVLPLHQHIGADAKILVEVGQQVLKGEKLAAADGYISAPVHAPTSGRITAIEPRPVAHPSGLPALCAVMESDGAERWIDHHGIVDYAAESASALRNIIREAGIVGLGGAGFPSNVKLNPGPDYPIDTLILNGAECEPYITCDDRLMRERADEIIGGALIMCHALQVRQCIVAIEDNKPEAIATMQAAAGQIQNTSVNVVAIATCYPAGGEKQLVFNITGREVPSNGLPLHVGTAMHNVATARAVHRAVVRGEPLISRVVTVTGRAARNPGNYDVLIGTPIDVLLQSCGGTITQPAQLVMGGSMMGIQISHAQAPVVKTTNCIIAAQTGELQGQTHFRACIRCGACAEVCPVVLQPQHLYWYARGRHFEFAQRFGLFDCIECGCCSYVCPSRIPLVQFYRYAKAEIWALEKARVKSDQSRVRFEQRGARLLREKREREEKLKQRRQSLQNKSSEAGDDDPIAAAIARAKAKKDKRGESEQE